MTASLVIDFAGKNHLQDIYVTGILVVAAVAALVLLGYLVAAKDPDPDTAFLIVLCGMCGAIAWPGVVVGGLLTGLVLGLRWIVHHDRKQRKIADDAALAGLRTRGASYRIKEDPAADFVAGRIEVEEFERRIAKQLEGE